MNSISLIKFQTAVAGLLFTALLTAGPNASAAPGDTPAAAAAAASKPAAAQAPSAPAAVAAKPTDSVTPLPQNPAQCPAGYVKTSTDGQGNANCAQIAVTPEQTRCETTIKDWYDANKALGKTSPSLISKARKCSDDEEDFGDDELELDDEDYVAQTGPCSEVIASETCPELNAGTAADYRRAQTDAEKDQQDASAAVDDVQSEMEKLQREGKVELKKIEEDTKSAEREYQERQGELEESIRKQTGEIKGAESAAFVELQNTFIKFKAEDKKLQAEYRAAQDAIAEAEGAVEVACRTEANKHYREAEARLQERKVAFSKSKRNFSVAGLVGSDKRQKEERIKQLKMDYANRYKECTEGMSDAGAAAKETINAAKRRLETLKASQAASRELLADSLKLEMHKYAEQQQMLAQAKADLETNGKKQIERMTAGYKASIEANQQRYIDEQDRVKGEYTALQRKMNQAYQVASSAQSEFMTAQQRYSCSKSGGGTIGESAATRRLTDYDKLLNATRTKESVCDAIAQPSAQVCNGVGGTDIEGIRKACREPGSSSTRTSRDTESKQ